MSECCVSDGSEKPAENEMKWSFRGLATNSTTLCFKFREGRTNFKTQWHAQKKLFFNIIF
jgi:hypothetical protein